ncbi:MAG: hypothetical protein HY329_04630 [Chloroflexi bacterium]|nr:hypothetical protein [Chloroflexota bacterium]
MSDQAVDSIRADLRAALARHGISVAEGDLAAGTAYLVSIRAGLAALDQLDLSGVEPTTFPRFGD